MNNKENNKTPNEKGDVNNMTPPIERYCTVEESIRESMKEVKLMREGRLPKKSWADFKKEMEDEV